MKSWKHMFLTVVVLLGIGWLLGADTVVAATCDPWSAKLVSVQGSVEVRTAASPGWTPARLGTLLCPGDMVRVNQFSRAALLLGNESLLRLDERTTITLSGTRPDKPFLIRLVEGMVFFFSRFPRKLEALTPFVNATIEGTEFSLTAAADHSLVTVIEGRVLASNTAGSVGLTAGEAAIARRAAAPVSFPVLRPRDAVRWALFYPPIIDWRPAEFAPGQPGTWQYWTQQSIEFYWQGDLSKAYDALGNILERVADPRFFLYRAALSLTVGRIQTAEDDIRHVLSLDPGNGEALALQALIALVHNQKEKARGLVEKALAAAPGLPTVHVAQSYVRQAQFDIEGALQSLEEASNLGPDNALVWARLAELYLAAGFLEKSTASAEKAVRLNPALARTQTVFGFSALVRINLAEAQAAFEEAVRLDSADPLARLGLGLARIRAGNLNAGRAEIEVAAGLDPNNALIRSYLGKAYFEEREEAAAQKQYAIAKELDPNDPTAFFYNAILNQTTNRPVEALQNLQKARELNDNRAVFRSRLLLDSDEAARSAAVARVYNDLGFQQRALFEGWMAVNNDPTDFSAHRFLADSYAALPRREIARVSELLQSQLLQPLNITPIQPRLAESNLFLISAGGPTNLSFTEFNPLFNRNRLALQGSGLLAENDTQAGEGIVSGIHDRLSFSGGYTYFDTDGWRENADQNDKIANLFAQYEITPRTSVQAEYRYRDLETGDLQLRFFKNDFQPDLEEEEKRHTARLGFHHRFSPGSGLVGNFQYQNLDGDVEDETIPGLVGTRIDSDADEYGGELQHLFRTDRLNIVSGIGYFDIDSRDITKVDLLTPPPPQVVQDINIDGDVQHLNAYLYAHIDLPLNLALTFGGSYDDFDGDDNTPDEDQFNPKLGVIWTPLPKTTLRAAAFRVLKRTLITDQTLEPTQVAGFNQFFDDNNASDVWGVGGAVDQKFSASLFGGVEYYYRNLSSPYNLTNDDNGFDLRDAKWEENIFRAYLFWTPHEWFSLTAEYLLEDFDRDEDSADGAREVTTHYLPLGVNFFHPSGFSAALKGTQIYQDGDFERQGAVGTFRAADDSFFLVDAVLGYRLPKRYGRLSVGVRNLFDTEGFEYLDTDEDNPRIQPDRTVFIQLTLAIP